MSIRLKAYATLGVSSALYIPIEEKELPSEYYGSLVRNRKVILEKCLPEDKKVEVFCHEILHHLLDHIQRGQGKHPQLWNIATDHVVNSLLKDLGFGVKDGIILPGAPRGPAEVVYRRLLQEMENAVENGQSTFSAYGANFRITTSTTYVDGKEAPKHGNENLEMPSARTEFEQTAKDRGLSSSEVQREFERAKTSVRWEKYLFSRVASTLGIRKNTFTYTKLPFYGRAVLRRKGLRIPGVYGRDLTLAVAIDTSGSISKHELSIFLTNVEQLRKIVSDLWVFVCDAEIHEVYHNPPNVSTLRISGGGGTNFTPVFNEINERGVRPHLMIFFTDTYGVFPEKPPSYPVIWVVVETDVHSVNIPFGSVLKI